MKLQIAVLWQQGRWTLLAPGLRFDRYGSRQSALEAARRLCDQAARQGHELEVLVQEIGGELSRLDLGEPIARSPNRLSSDLSEPAPRPS
jgi:hypothetical protein